MVSLGVGGLSCHSCTVPPLFSFLCLRSFPFRCFPFGVLPLYRVGWHVCLQCASLLFGVAGGGLLRLFPQCQCAVFPAAGTLVFLGLSCSACLLGWLFFAPCVRVFQLQCCLLGLQVGFPCCLFLALGGCTSGYGVSRVCGLRRRFRLPFVVLHPLPVSDGPSPFSGVGVVFGHALVAPPATLGFGLF